MPRIFDFTSCVTGPGEAGDAFLQQFFSLAETARIFGKTARTMRGWASDGTIKTVRIGRTRYVTRAEISRLADRGQGEASAQEISHFQKVTGQRANRT